MAASMLMGGGSKGLIGSLLEVVMGVKPDRDAPEWSATIFTTGQVVDKLTGKAKDKTPILDFLDLTLIGETGKSIDAEKKGKDLASWKWDEWESLDGRDIGFSYTGKVRIPPAIGTPTLAIFKHTGGKGNPTSFYISKLVLLPPENDATGQQPITFAVNSHIHSQQDPQVFFDDKPRLPEQTSQLLQLYRTAELHELRGTEELRNPREWDRVYQYDVYNDIGNPEKRETERAILGGLLYKDGPYDEEGLPNMADAPTPCLLDGTHNRKLAFPRRLRTGRGHYKNTMYENMPPKKEPDFWLPQDEKFDPLKASNFDRSRQLYVLGTVNGILSILAKEKSGLLRGILGVLTEKPFPDFDAYESLFTSAADKFVKLDDLGIAIARALGKLPKSMLAMLGCAFNVDQKSWDQFLESTEEGKVVVVNPEAHKVFEKVYNLIKKLVFEKPLVIEDREDLWRTDEEWGRQTIAGQNPCIIQAINAHHPSASGFRDIPPESTVNAQHLEPSLGGHALSDILNSEKPRLFLIDYSAVYPQYTKLINASKDVHQYAGRAFLFLRDDNQLVPVAIELFTREAPAEVYTPLDPPNVWLVAKAVFISIDSGFHQLYSHFTRTHGSMEPALIATRRQLSAMHPVYKLLMPHFRFTLNINKNARQTLINNDGIIEKTFTPGKFSMTLAAEVYGALWTFESQSLPNDLISRGMAKKGANGEVEMLLPDYPYGSDGLLVWNSVEKWVSKYLSLYYTGTDGATITGDSEIQAWWKEFKNEGHPDIKKGWPKLETVEDLTQILTTIIWTASAHHAAVNFGQYDYSAYMPNRSSTVHKPIPAKGSKDYKDLVANLDRNFFKTVASPIEAGLVTAAIGLLSTHSENEQYISDKEHFYIFHQEARELYEEHVQNVLQIEEEIEKRNADPNSTARNPSKGGLPYKLLLPTSTRGRTGRGIPTSVSI